MDTEKNYTHTLYMVPIEEGPVQTWKKSRRSKLRKGVLIVIPMMNWSCYIQQNELPKTDEEEDKIYRKLFDEMFESSFFHQHAKEVANQIAVLLRI